MLSPMTRRVLHAIQGYQQSTGQSPSIMEIAKMVGVSKTPAYGAVLRLEERGYLRKLPGKARSIEVLRPIRGTAYFVVREGKMEEIQP